MIRAAELSAGRPAGVAAISWQPLLAIAAASFLVCVAADIFYFGSKTISSDEDRIIASAAHWLATGEFRVGRDVAWEMPGAALFFAPLHFFPGNPLNAIRFAQAALVGVQALMLGALATLVFNDRFAGIAAALIGGFYPYLVFTQGLALSETLFIFLLVAGFLSLYAWRARGARLGGLLALTVTIFVLATLTKATLTVLTPLLVVAGALGLRPWRQVALIFLAATALYALLLTPWWVRNYRLLGAFVPFTTSASHNLYMGNNPNNPNVGTYAPDLPSNWTMDRGVNIAAIPGELDRYRRYRDAALTHIAAEPFDFFRRAALKFAVFWNLIPNAPQFRGFIYKLFGFLSFAPILLFAAVCAFHHRRNAVRFLPFYLTIGYFTALYVVTIASIRYRLPIEPLLIVLAAEPIARLTCRFIPPSLRTRFR